LKDVRVIRKDINRVEEFIVHEDVGMIVQNPAQKIRAGSFPTEHHKASSTSAAVITHEVSQKTLSSIARRAFEIEVQICDPSHVEQTISSISRVLAVMKRPLIRDE
jgi:hypothetical protein